MFWALFVFRLTYHHGNEVVPLAALESLIIHPANKKEVCMKIYDRTLCILCLIPNFIQYSGLGDTEY